MLLTCNTGESKLNKLIKRPHPCKSYCCQGTELAEAELAAMREELADMMFERQSIITDFGEKYAYAISRAIDRKEAECAELFLSLPLHRKLDAFVSRLISDWDTEYIGDGGYKLVSDYEGALYNRDDSGFFWLPGIMVPESSLDGGYPERKFPKQWFKRHKLDSRRSAIGIWKDASHFRMDGYSFSMLIVYYPASSTEYRPLMTLSTGRDGDGIHVLDIEYSFQDNVAIRSFTDYELAQYDYYQDKLRKHVEHCITNDQESLLDYRCTEAEWEHALEQIMPDA